MKMSNDRQRKLFDAIAQTLNRIALVSAKLNSHIASATCSQLSVPFFDKMTPLLCVVHVANTDVRLPPKTQMKMNALILL